MTRGVIAITAEAAAMVIDGTVDVGRGPDPGRPSTGRLGDSSQSGGPTGMTRLRRSQP